MAKFLYIYSGGGQPASPEEGQRVMQAWMAYFGRLGDKIVDGGAPLGARQAVAGAAPSGASGYSIISAGDMAEAVALTDGHPHLMSAGAAIEVLEVIPIGP
jgi:hypothetical protein